MKQNRNDRTGRKPSSRTLSIRMRAFLCAVFSAVAVAITGCEGPSTITVTGVIPAQSEDGFSFAERPSSDAGNAGSTVPDPTFADSSAADPDIAAASFVNPDQASGGTGTGEPAQKEESLPAEQIAVYVCGAVRNAGVYYLPPGSRICDALEAAGGFLENADSQWLNQAKALSDGEMLVAYTKEETAQMRLQGLAQGSGAITDAAGSGQQAAGAAGGAGKDAAQAAGDGKDALVNLNTASREQLMSLPGIGEAKADAIIRYRTETGMFASIEDVMNISGIKNSIFDKIKDRITV